MYYARKSLRVLLSVLMLLMFLACEQEQVQEEQVFECTGKCDSVGALTISNRWAPRGGFVRVSVASDYDLKVEPNQGVNIRETSTHSIVTFENEGFYRLTAIRGTQNGGELVIRVSDTGPALDVLDPAPGAFVQWQDNQNVAIRFTITDPLGGPLQLTARGVPVTQGEDGAYIFSHPGEFGINFVDINATDTANNTFVYTYSFMGARSYTQAPSRCEFKISDTALNSMAAKLQSALPGLVKIPAIEEPVDHALGHDLYFQGATLPGQNDNPGSIALDIKSSDNLLRVLFKAQGETIAFGYVERVLFSDRHFEAWITNMRMDLSLSFTQTEDGPYPVVQDIKMYDDGLEYSVQGLPDWLTPLFTSFVRKRMVDVMREVLPKMLHQSLQSVQEEMQVSIPVLDKEIPMQVSYTLDDIKPSAGALVLDISARVSSAYSNPDYYGAPYHPETTVSTAGTTQSMAMALSYNQINGFLFEMWRAGALSFAFDESYLAEIIKTIPEIELLNPQFDITLDLGLPPVVEPDPTAPGSLRISVGEIRVVTYMATSLFQVTISANLGGRARLGLQVTDNTLHIDSELLEFHVDIEQRAFAGLNTEAVEALLRALVPEVVSQITQQMENYTLPRFDLSVVDIPNVILGVDDAIALGNPDAFIIAGDIIAIENL